MLGLLLFISVLTLVSATSLAGAQTFTVIGNFGVHAGEPGFPQFDSLASSRVGIFYGATCGGGTNNQGVVFRFPITGGGTSVHSFTGTDGSCPNALTLGTDDNYYGTTTEGGVFNYGTFYQLTPAGTVTIVYNFTGGSDGGYPVAAPLEAADGNFYGTTTFGGDAACEGGECGTIYKISRTGAFTLLHTFEESDGVDAVAPLVQASDGRFYGTATQGGIHGAGTVFRISSSGAFKVLHRFSQFAKGTAPGAPLVQGSDGSLYGTTSRGGQGGFEGDGVIFKISPTGVFSVLHGFVIRSDGGQPHSGLVQGNDGNFYGATAYGGAYTHGTLYRITASGTFTTLHDFDGPTGEYPQTTPVQNADGVIYGETSIGGTGTFCFQGTEYGCGVVYGLNLRLPPFVTFLPPQRAGRAGKKIQIFGQGLTGATAVSFNGTPATFQIVRSTFMTATVPEGAKTGYVTVTTPTGVLTSNVPFTVLP
jgi:uncharacterized repeat protein (TIGR03803 family)